MVDDIETYYINYKGSVQIAKLMCIMYIGLFKAINLNLKVDFRFQGFLVITVVTY